MPVSHEDEEEALQGSEIPVTLEEEQFSMTRSKFKDLIIIIIIIIIMDFI